MSFTLVNPIAEKYAEKATSSLANIQRSVYQNTVETHHHAHLISTEVQGKFLSFLSNMLKPKYVLEIGTFTGFSALCLEVGIEEGGELHTIELREEDAATALKNFKVAQKDKKIILHVGDAKEIVPTLPYTWDLVFIDADKTSYVEYYELVVPRLSERGLIVADNVLFHGQVLHEPIENKNAKAIDMFNKHVATDTRVEQVMLTVRDGLLLIKKK